MYDIDKIKEKYYSIEIDIIFENETIALEDSDIVEFSQQNDYLKLLVPITTVTFAVSDYLKEKIQKNKDTVKLAINIMIDKNTDTQKTVLSKTFIPMIEDETTNPYKETNDLDKSNKDEAKLNTMTLYIFEETNLTAIKKTFNLVFANEEISNIIYYLLSQLGLSFLVSPINKTGTIGELFIPNLNLKSSIMYLQKVYGIFEYGVRFYLDNTRAYLLSKSLDTIPIEVNEPKQWDMYILGDVTEAKISTGQYLDKVTNNVIFLGQQKTMKIENLMSTDKHIEGEKIVVQKTSDFNGTTEINNKTMVLDTSEDNIRIKNYYDPYDNDYNQNEVELDRISKTKVLSLPMSNISILDVTPNKCYNFIFENELQSYNGIYRLDAFNFSINKKQSSNDFTLEGSACFTTTK